MTPEEYFLEMLSEIPEAKLSKMFGAICYKMPNGKASAMFWRDFLVVKLKGENLEEALSFDGTQIFEPMEGRKMNGWVQIPFDYKNRWKEFTIIASKEVALLEKKPLKKAKKE